MPPDATPERRTPPVDALDGRVRALEERAIADDGLHRNLVLADSQTAIAVEKLTASINDPRSGLIVELDQLRAEIKADRATFRAWVRGATAVLSVVFTVITVISPWVRAWLEAAVHVGPVP